MTAANSQSAREGTHHQSPEDLAIAARHEPVQSSRSRLAPCAQVIFILREKRWSFAAITAWLKRHDVQVAESTVQRFYRTQHRNSSREQSHPPPGDHRPSISPSNPTHEAHESHVPRSPTHSASRPKYNTDF